MNDKKTKDMLYNIIKNGKNNTSTPIFIDFYVDYKQSSYNFVQIVDNTKSKYEGKIVFVSVDIEKEPELAGVFNVIDTPKMILIPKDGTPNIKNAALNQETLEYYLDGLILDELYTEIDINDEVIDDVNNSKNYEPAELLQSDAQPEVIEQAPKPERPKRPQRKKTESNRPKPERPKRPQRKKTESRRPRPQKKKSVPKNEEVKPKEKSPGFFERFKK
tara:strand:+ start:54 stop:707 length:654 start_codon:yes stop_codon:yes gene_type:complete